MLEFRPVEVSAAALERYRALFAACFPGAAGKFTPAYLAWLYADNPDGHALGYDAWDGDTLAAHYVCIPALAHIEGEEVKVLLSLNTATHPNYQGKGLFTKLAAMTYEAGAAAGFDGVYGVANANSTPGFVRKLGFQLVRPLEARVGVGRIRPVAQNSSLSFQRCWSAASLAWRCSSPGHPVRVRSNGQQLQLDAAALGAARAVDALALNLPTQDHAAAWAPLNLYLGLRPDGDALPFTYVNIPQRLRPSPLNLIYRSLSGRVAQLDPSRIHFSFLDFDAY
jgi:GNAT superfamily N-acetyltransferase